MNKRHKVLLLALLVVVLLVAAGVSMYALRSKSTSTSGPASGNASSVASPVQNEHTAAQTPAGGEPITVVGVVGCLTPSKTAGQQNASCAIGLKADDGKSYALGSDDPTLTGSIPSGQRVRVSGSFIKQASSYDAEGLIHVTSIERL